MNNISYSEVYSWFEKSGIISNIRTHLRQNLVNALKNKTNSRDNKADVRSAKQYVYDMLIAEYLLNYNYAYTLSVFTSEAPLLINLNQQTPVSRSGNQIYSKNKLPTDYVSHTLQTLGICPKNSDGRNISSQYATGAEPLILFILRHLVSRSLTKSREECESDERPLTRSQRTQTECHEMTKLSEAKEKLYRQKEIFASQLRNKEFELNRQAQSIETQLVSLNDKLKHAQDLMRLVESKENNLAKERIKTEQILRSKELELLAKEKSLAQEAERLQKERDSYRTFEGDMRKLQEELVRVRNDLPGSSTNLTKVKLLEACVQTEMTESTTSAEELRLLTEEKRELSNMIKDQNSRIEELTLRAVSLARQLEEAQLFISPNIDPSNSVVRRVNVNTIFSESSSTEDILQDAKMRLRRLEEESLRADRYFYNCITSP